MTSIVADGPLATVHGLLWIAALLVAAVGLALGIGAIVQGRGAALWLDRILLAYLAVVALDELVGLGNAAFGKGPADALHLLYAFLAIVAAPVARYLGRTGAVRRRTAWQAAGWAVSLGFLIRLLMTGAG